jgi:hypothetical protein
MHFKGTKPNYKKLKRFAIGDDIRQMQKNQPAMKIL